MRLPREVVGIPIRRILLIAALLAVVSFGGSLVYLLTRPPAGRTEAPVEPAALPTAPRRMLVPVDSNTLAIPDENEGLVRSHWVRYRPPRERWSADEVERFWIDPAAIGTEYLSGINRSLIEEMLKGIP